MQNFDGKYKSSPETPEDSSGVSDHTAFAGGIDAGTAPRKSSFDFESKVDSPKTSVSDESSGQAAEIYQNRPLKSQHRNDRLPESAGQTVVFSEDDRIQPQPIFERSDARRDEVRRLPFEAGGAQPDASISVDPGLGGVCPTGSAPGRFVAQNSGNYGNDPRWNAPARFSPSFEAAKKEAKRCSNAIAAFVLAIAAMTFGFPTASIIPSLASKSSEYATTISMTLLLGLIQFSFSVAAIAAGAVGIKSKYKSLAVTGLVFGCIILLGILLSMFVMCSVFSKLI